MWAVFLRSLTIQRRLLFCILVLLCQHDFLCEGQSSGQGLSTHPQKKGFIPGKPEKVVWKHLRAPLDTPTPAGCDCMPSTNIQTMPRAEAQLPSHVQPRDCPGQQLELGVTTQEAFIRLRQEGSPHGRELPAWIDQSTWKRVAHRGSSSH